MAIWTSHRPHIAFELATLRHAVRVAILVQQVGDDPFEHAAVLHRRLAAAPRVGDVQLAGAPQPELLKFRFEFFPRCLQHGARFEFMHAFDRLRHAVIDVPPPAPEILPATDQRETSLLEVQRRVGNEQAGIEGVEFAQAVAFVAHALWAVEAEQLRRRRLEAQSTVGAGVIDREDRIAGPCLRAARRLVVRGLLGLDLDEHRSFANRQRQLDGFGKSRPDVGLVLQPVDHDFDVVPHLAIEMQVVVQRNGFAVDSRADESLFQQIDEQIAILALLSANQRGQHRELRVGREMQNAGDDLLPRLTFDLLAALRTEALSDSREQDSQVVVDLGDCADRRARVVAARFLRDRNRGAQAAEIIDVGLGHLAEELPRKAGQTFDVAALSFGIHGIEGQRTLAGTADSGQANQFVSRQD